MFITGMRAIHQQMTMILAFLLLTMGVAVPVGAQSSETFVIGEISNIGGAVTVTTNGVAYDRRQEIHTALAEMGYIEGENVTYLFDPEGYLPENREAAAQALVAANPDVIVAYGTVVAQLMREATAGTSIPVVFVGAVDPVQLGVVSSLQNTEGNVTGVGASSEAYGKQLEWLLLIDPTIERVYIPQLAQSTLASLNTAALAAIQEFAEKAGVELLIPALPSTDPEVLEAAIDELYQADADAIMILVGGVPSDPFIEAAMELGIPVTTAFPNAMDAGALLSYNYTEYDVAGQAARYIDLILRGAAPSSLPVELAPNSLAINLATAEAIGLNIADEILQQASIIVR